MAINIQKLLEAIQTSIGNATPATPTRELEILTKGAFKWGDNQITSFDSDGEFLDSATTSPYLLAYHTGKKNIYAFDSGSWQSISGTVAANITQAQGSTSGYSSGGWLAPGISNVIDKFPFSTDANATDVGDLTLGRYIASGQSSTASGYSSGGSTPALTPFIVNNIDKFPFSADANATDVGDLTVARTGAAGQSSDTSGYSAGGGLPAASNVIDKFPFASDGNATDVGDLTSARRTTGQSSTVSGYSSGGVDGTPTTTNIIDKFPFATDTNATDVGDLTVARRFATGQNSDASGYSSGGVNPTPPPAVTYNVIDKFPFSADANATDVGDLTVARYSGAGQSSDASGYTSGGWLNPGNSNVIDKFPFASDGNATDVGDLTVARIYVTGQQV